MAPRECEGVGFLAGIFFGVLPASVLVYGLEWSAHLLLLLTLALSRIRGYRRSMLLSTFDTTQPHQPRTLGLGRRSRGEQIERDEQWSASCESRHRLPSIGITYSRSSGFPFDPLAPIGVP